MKKNILGMSTLTLSLFPVLAITSCSMQQNDITKDYKISSIFEHKTIRTSMINGDQYKKLDTLEALFNGINNGVIKNISVKISEKDASTNKTNIILIANTGFTINGLSQLESVKFVENDITILKNDGDIRLSPDQLQGDKLKSLGTLQQVFTGVWPANINDYDVEYSSATKMITLSAKEGLTINKEKSITSNIITIFE